MAYCLICGPLLVLYISERPLISSDSMHESTHTTATRHAPRIAPMVALARGLGAACRISVARLRPAESDVRSMSSTRSKTVGAVRHVRGALTVHPSARRSTRYACTHRSPMHVSPSMRCIHSRCEWPRLVLARTPRPSMHVSPLMRAAARSTHALSLPSYACDRIHRRLRSDLLRVLSYSGSWVWDFQIPLWL